MMKKILFTGIMLFVSVLVGFAQIETDGDYRSVSSGNWSNIAIWQVRTSGSWLAASAIPGATNNVYLQTGHAVNIDLADAFCKDLHWGFKGAVYGSVTLNTNNINVNGKVRVYSILGSAVTGLGADGGFYLDQTSSTATNASQFVTATTLGYLKFVGNTRDITVAGEWNGSGTVCYGVFALNPGQVGTLNAGMKFRGLDFKSGNIVSNNVALVVGSTAGNGDVTIQNGAKFTTSRATQAITQGSAGLCGTINIQAGGILELTNTNAEINCTTFINDGTVIYSGSTQNLVKAGLPGGDPLTSYKNLIVSAGTSLTLPVSKNIAVSGALTFTNGNLVIPSTSVLELATGNTTVSGASESSYIKTLVDGAVSGTLKVTGLSTAQTFPVGSANHYLPVTLNPTTPSNFSINVFDGATADATPNGTPLTADQKKRMVNAVWNINRTAGSGNCGVTLGWSNALEGSDFATFTNSQVGIAVYTAGAYTAFLGNGDNTANTATQTVSNFAPMIVGEFNTTLPVKLISFTAKESLNSVQLAWKTTSEKGLAKYIVQYANDSSVGFKNIYAVTAHNLDGTFDYSYVDVNPVAGNNYYRLISEDLDGTQYISEVKSVNIKGGDLVNAYPNPVLANSLNVSGLTAGDVIKIYDLKGVVIVSKISDANSMNKVDLEGVKPGVYFLSIENSGKITTTKRLIKL